VGMKVGGEYLKITSTTPYSREKIFILNSFILNLQAKNVSRGVIVLTTLYSTITERSLMFLTKLIFFLLFFSTHLFK
jgi:hypothetical protein